MRSFAPITREYEAAVMANVVVRRNCLRLFVSICELYVRPSTTSMQLFMPRLIALLLISFLSFAAPGPATKTATSQNRPAVSDAQLDSTIRARLAKSKIGKDGFRFHVQHGVVTWEGNTAVGQHKGAATRMARSSGAIQVVNNIKVNGAGKETSLRKAYVQP